jgi:hypothetical protein
MSLDAPVVAHRCYAAFSPPQQRSPYAPNRSDVRQPLPHPTAFVLALFCFVTQHCRLAATNSSDATIKERLEQMGVMRLMTLRLLSSKTVYAICCLFHIDLCFICLIEILGMNFSRVPLMLPIQRLTRQLRIWDWSRVMCGQLWPVSSCFHSQNQRSFVLQILKPFQVLFISPISSLSLLEATASGSKNTNLCTQACCNA